MEATGMSKSETAVNGSRTSVPPWWPRAVVVTIAIIVAVLAGWWVLVRLRGLLLILLVSLFLSFAVEPAVDWLAARGWRRGLATGFAFLVIFVALIGFGAALGSLFVGQVQELAESVPSWIDRGIVWVNGTFDTKISVDTIQRELSSNSGSLQAYAGRLASNALGISATAVGLIFQTFTVLLFTFYLCADGPRFRRTVCSVLPPRTQREVLRAWDIAVDKTGGYIYSRAIMAACAGTAHYVLFRIIELPYALALSVFVAVASQFVPTVGTYIAAALPVIVALTSQPLDVIWILGFVLLYQQVENYLLAPRITAHTLAIHPAVAFGSVIAGAAVLGAVGAFLALPAAASIQAFVSTYIRRYAVVDGEAPPDQRDPNRAKHWFGRIWGSWSSRDEPPRTQVPDPQGSPAQGSPAQGSPAQESPAQESPAQAPQA